MADDCIKICAGASSGGHMNQLLKLLDNSTEWPKQPEFYVTTLDVLAERLKKKGRVYIIGEANRYHPIRALKILYRSVMVVIRERPKIVISTGSMPLALFSCIAKVSGSKVVWIDSIANIDRISLSGRFVRLFADLFLTQWPDLAIEKKNIKYVGEIL